MKLSSLIFKLLASAVTWRQIVYSFWMAIALQLSVTPAHAGSFDGAMGKTGYKVFVGDVNGDGVQDILVKAVPKIVMIPIDDDLDVPIPIPPKSPSFVLLSGSAGTYTLSTNPSAQTLAFAWVQSGYQLTFGGPAGTAADSVQLSSPTLDLPSFLVTMAGDNGQLQLSSYTGSPAENSRLLAAVDITPPHLGNANAGSLPGTLDVNSSGAATYIIDLVVPPGTNGMQPSLSLSYTSQGQNGLFGLGWSLGGLSSIQRCGKTIAQDGVNQRINFTNSDRLCLDGQRLVLSNKAMSDENYWAADAQYRTEIESFVRVTAENKGPNGARSFLVEARDGRISTYGVDGNSSVRAVIGTVKSGTTAAQPSAKNGPQSWALSSTVDRLGNFIKVTYEQDAISGEHRPSYIRYGGAGLTSHAAVQFSYEGRPDAWKRYIDETRNDLRSRVTHIKTFIGDNLDGTAINQNATLVRDYTLTYEQSPTSGRTMLSSIGACARHPVSGVSECIPATTFAWGKPDPSKKAGFTSRGTWAGGPILTTHALKGVGGLSPQAANHADYFAFSDFDHDGLSDVLEKRVASMRPSDLDTYDGQIRESSNPIKPGTMQSQYRFFHNSGNSFTTHYYTIDSGESFVVLDVGDFNGDGALDLFIYSNEGAKICLSPLADPNALGAPGSTIKFACGPKVNGSWRNEPGGRAYVFDALGDGRSAVYSATRIGYEADFCNLDGCLKDTSPPYILGLDQGFPFNPYDGNTEFAVVEYTSFTQMVDFTGIGKSYDTRWTEPFFQQYTYDGNERLETNTWNNFTPEITMTSLGRPGEATGSMAAYTYPGYPMPPRGSTIRSPYTFDKPYQGNSLASDFNGSGYNGLAFGFIEIGWYENIASNKRAEMTLCLSTGRALDCDVRKKYSGENYRAVSAVGNFVGDGMAAILVQPLTPNAKWRPTPSGAIEICRVVGDDTTDGAGTDDNNMVCTPWSGLQLPEDSGNAALDKVYFMDLLGTGRTQLVYYHSGKMVNGSWQEDGRWEVFEPIDVAVEGEALDRLVRVTNGIGAIAKAEYGDALSTNLVGSTGRTWAYPEQESRVPGKLVRRLTSSNGVAEDRRRTYKYYDGATNLAGRGSLGFAMVVSTDEQTSFVTTTKYAQSWPRTGMKNSVTTMAGTCAISDVTNSVSYRNISLAGGAFTYFTFVDKSKAIQRDLNCTELGSVTIRSIYGDDWGNITSQGVESFGANETYLTVTKTDFLNDETRWLLGLEQKSVTTKTTPTITSQESRTVNHEYDKETGLLLKDIMEKDDTRYQVVTEYSRTGNPFGLVTKKTQQWTNLAGDSKTRTVADITYDTKGRYPATIKNALGYPETYEYYAATGARKSLKDANGLTTSWTADGFGRVQVELHQDGNELRSYLKNCAGLCPLGAAVAEIKEFFHGTSRINVPQVVFSDNAGHILRTLTWGFDGNAILSDQRYDSRGRVYEQDWPRFETGPSYLQSRSLYDDMDRPTQTTSLDEQGAEHYATVKYDGFTRTLTNLLNYTRVETRNVIDQLKSVQDPNRKLTKFDYEAFGALSTTTDPAGNVITIKYDRLGRKTDLYDPDLGHIEYAVDALGRTVRQVSPKQRIAKQATTMEFDDLDRMIARYESDLESHWKFDTAAMGIGQLAEAYTKAGPVFDYRRTHTYDAYGRPKVTTQNLSDGVYTGLTEYDTWSRPLRQSYQREKGGKKVFENRYSNTGYLARIMRGDLALWAVATQDAALRITKAQLGNGLIQQHNYNPYTGRLSDGVLKTNSDLARLQESYEYDLIGSVAKRIQYWEQGTSLIGFQENFHYDSLNRIEWSQVLGQTKQVFNYDAAGNILNKTGVGTGDYVYPIQGVNSVRPHGVSSIPGVGDFFYDDNGNLTSGKGRSMTWTSFDMPLKMSAPGASASFVYGTEHQRLRQNRGDGSMVVYAGAQEVETKNGQVTVKTYWPAGIGVEIDRPGITASELNWTHLDRLGSVVAITDDAGASREKLAYDAWGKRRTLDGAAIDGTPAPDSIDGKVDNRGFAGHEMLDQLDLVHMNGRVYDPLIARFVSGDPLISDPLDGQRYNRYSYVLNNPTNLTDPTGFDDIDPNKPKNQSAMTGSHIPGVDTGAACYGGGCKFTFDKGSPEGGQGKDRKAGQDSGGGKTPTSATDRSTTGSGSSANNGGMPSSDPGGQLIKTTSVKGTAYDGTGVERITATYTRPHRIYGSSDYYVGGWIGIAANGIPFERVGVLIWDAVKLAKAAKFNPCKCFVAGTPVHTKDGIKLIEEIKVDDLVAARDEETGETKWKPVRSLIRNDETNFIELKYVDSIGEPEQLVVTVEHPFMLEGNHWSQAGDLKVGDRIIRLADGVVTVSSVVQKHLKLKTYNFEVADFHTYFVGNKGVWVHNACDLLAQAAQVADKARRRLATLGDKQFATAKDALAEALKRHGVDPSTVETVQMYGKNPNLVGPKGEPWQKVRGLNSEGEIIEIEHHMHGHSFPDKTFEIPHYHGPEGEHLTY